MQDTRLSHYQAKMGMSLGNPQHEKSRFGMPSLKPAMDGC